MNILLVNPPNCGRSIPEERYGIDSIKQIFRGEPLALEALAGNLEGHEVGIVDLKAEPGGLQSAINDLRPELVALTGVTCEANTVLRLAGEIKESVNNVTVVVGGIHASNDPLFFNRPQVDYVVLGLGKASLQELVAALEQGTDTRAIPGVMKTNPGHRPGYAARNYSTADLVDDKAPRYDLVARYRDSYVLSSLGIKMGFVSTAFGCPFNCGFCCIGGLTGGRYLTHRTEAVLRDIRLLGDIPVIRLLDANTFGDPGQARDIAARLQAENIRKQYLADVRSDTVVRHPELMKQWKEAGLRAVIIGFEEIDDLALARMNKANKAATNTAAIEILHELGITIVGDFIVSPEYREPEFDRLERYIAEHEIDLPMITVLTPLPGTALHGEMQDRLTETNLDYYTLTNAVTPTALGDELFYQRYADLVKKCHAKARL